MRRSALVGVATALLACLLATSGCQAQPVTGVPQPRSSVALAPLSPPTGGAAAKSPASSAASASVPVATPTPVASPSPVEAAAAALLAPGSTGAQVRELQARLRQIGWFAGLVTGNYDSETTKAVQGFQAKRGLAATGTVDQGTWDRLVAMTRTPTKDELANRISTAGLDPRCLQGRAICISKSTRQLTWVVDGVALLRLDVRFGAVATPTREGAFVVEDKRREWISTLYQSSMPFSMFFSGGQAIHYSSDFAARGYSGASHGCVNVRDWNGIAWLFDQVRLGDPVIVFW